MATYFSILAWEIPWTEEPGGATRGHKSPTRLNDWTTITKESIRQHPFLQLERHSEGSHQVEGFIGRRMGQGTCQHKRASLVAQLVKSSPAMQEISVQLLVRKIPWRRDRLPTPLLLDFPGDSAGKESAHNWGDMGLIPGWGRTPGEGKATSSSIPAWRIPWTVQSMESQRVRHNWATLTFILFSSRTSFCEGEKYKGFSQAACLFFLWGWREYTVTDYLHDLDPKNSKLVD